MLYLTKYESILGELTLVSDEENLVGLWIEGQKHFMGKLAGMDVVELDLIEADEDSNIAETFQMRENVLKARNILECVKTWLEQYFTGENPNPKELPLAPKGSEFQELVWRYLCEIPYGEVITYGELARKVAVQMGKQHMSAQAIGGAVGRNPISIIIPCHRVVGADGSLTGYAGGVEKKRMLLELEGSI